MKEQIVERYYAARREWQEIGRAAVKPREHKGFYDTEIEAIRLAEAMRKRFEQEGE